MMVIRVPAPGAAEDSVVVHVRVVHREDIAGSPLRLVVRYRPAPPGR